MIKRAKLVGLMAALLVTGMVGMAEAQGYRAEFSPSPDHNAVAHGAPVLTRYEVTVTAATGGPVLATINAGKPAPVGGTISVDVNTQILALPAGTYRAQVVAIGPGGTSDPFTSPNFTLAAPAPGPPSGLIIRIVTTTEALTDLNMETGAIVGQVTTSNTHIERR